MLTYDKPKVFDTSILLCLSASQSLVKIDPAIPEISRNKQTDILTDRLKLNNMIFWYMYCIYIHLY